MKVNNFAPSDIYNHPEEIFKSNKITHKEKHELLTEWKKECLDKIRSAGEGMPAGNASNDLRLIETYLNKL